MGISKNKIVLLASAGMLTVGLGSTGAVAADLIGSNELQNGATCTAGAPRMFVEIQGTFVNSFDDQTGCAGDTAPSNTNDGTVTFTVPQNGRIGQAGFVYDNGVAGTVLISNVTIDGN